MILFSHSAAPAVYRGPACHCPAAARGSFRANAAGLARSGHERACAATAGARLQAPAATPALPALPVPDVALKLPRDLSPWGMFMAADIVVKAVMVGLAFASVLTWTIWLAKAIELMLARRRMRTAIGALGEARSWSEAQWPAPKDQHAAAPVAAADTELRMSADAFRRPASRNASPRGWNAWRPPPAGR